MEVQGRGRGRIPFYGHGRFRGRFSGKTGDLNGGRGVQVDRAEGSEASGEVQGFQNVQIVMAMIKDLGLNRLRKK